jgi:PAS domain S-box-containing protein
MATFVHSVPIDLAELFDAVDVPILAIHRDLTVAGFNRAAAEALDLAPSNVGHATCDISALCSAPGLEQSCSQVIAAGIPARKDFCYKDKSFVVRIAPYLQGSHEIGGALLSFINVTAFRASIDQAIYEREFTKGILNAAPDPLVVLSADLRVQTANRAFFTYLGLNRDGTINVPLSAIANHAFDQVDLRERLLEMLAGNCEFPPLELDHEFASSGHRTIVINARSFSLPNGADRLILLSFQDITRRKRSEEALLESERQLAAELKATQRLRDLNARLVRTEDLLSRGLSEILDAAIEISAADMGNIQLFENGVLKIVTQRGFERSFVEFFAAVHDGEAAWGTATQSGARVIIEDVLNSPIFAGTPARDVMLAAKALAVQSTPLISSSGRVLGMVSTYYHAPYRPNDREQRMLDLLARQAADLIERKQTEDTLTQREKHRALLVNELNHRVKNTLATIQSLAMQTLRDNVEPRQARALFDARLIALSNAHDILTRESWEGAFLAEIIDEAVAPHCGSGKDRFEFEGPKVWLSPKHALAMTMALHELCTNAAKYGALSNDIGQVRIEWFVTGLNGGPRLRMRWIETGGPEVRKPERRGFGSRLIERGLSQDLGGEVRIDFLPTGVICTISAPLDSATGGSENA